MPRRHGWGGTPPATDDEAVRRITAATRRCIDERGERVTITDVADALGVSRPTVYRYFPTTDALLDAVAFDSSRPFVARLERLLATIDDPVDAIIEGMAYAIEELPRDPYIGVRLASSRAGAFARGVTSSTARSMGRLMLDPLVTNWTELGAAPEEIDDLVEWALRVLQSLLLDPGDPPRSHTALRAYLDRWFAPALRTRPRD